MTEDITEDMIQQMANDAVATLLAEHESRRQPPRLTPEEEIADRMHHARFREYIGDVALLHGVRPSAVKHIVRDAEEVFTLDGVARNGQCDPADPLVPLTPARWLTHLRRTDSCLFDPERVRP